MEEPHIKKKGEGAYPESEKICADKRGDNKCGKRGWQPTVPNENLAINVSYGGNAGGYQAKIKIEIVLQTSARRSVSTKTVEKRGSIGL